LIDNYFLWFLIVRDLYLKVKIGRTFDKEVLPMELAGSPDRTSFATFVCLRKLIMCVTNWRRSLESVKDIKRQNLNKEVLPILLPDSHYWKRLELLKGI